jgi:hypothetical protein
VAIGLLEALCDRARADCRAGRRAGWKSFGNDGTKRTAYYHAWRREWHRLLRLGRLPQTELPLQSGDTADAEKVLPLGAPIE